MNSFKTPKGTVLPILNLKGKDYLQVAHRLVWFREEHPTYQIKTEFLKLENDFAIASASITDDRGCILATAHKREDRSHFADYLEKAEAGAIGRALAYCGFGTQFCADEINEGDRIVDAPQERKSKVEVEPPKMESSGYFVIKFGDDKGKTLKQLGPLAVSKKLQSIQKSKSDFKNSQMAKEFFHWADAFLRKNPVDELDQALGNNKPTDTDIRPPDDFMNQPMPEWT